MEQKRLHTSIFPSSCFWKLCAECIFLTKLLFFSDKLENYQIVKNNDTTEGLTVVLQPKGNSDGLSVR